MPLKRAFTKIGIISQTEAIKSMPSQEDRKIYRMNKYMELKRMYHKRKKRDPKPFEC